jgi:hypothetical protein
MKKLTPASKKDSAFWYCKVPKEDIERANQKRKSVKASKASIVMRMIKWYLLEEVEA